MLNEAKNTENDTSKRHSKFLFPAGPTLIIYMYNYDM